MSQETPYLFSYGLLRPACDDPLASELSRKWTHLGPATMQARLYAITHYPGLVDSDDEADIVYGDLVTAPSGAEVLWAELDYYEGCTPNHPEPHEYRRAVRPVLYEGRIIEAAVYLFNRPITDDLELIAGGDFLSWRRQRLETGSS